MDEDELNAIVQSELNSRREMSAHVLTEEVFMLLRKENARQFRGFNLRN